MDYFKIVIQSCPKIEYLSLECNITVDGFFDILKQVQLRKLEILVNQGKGIKIPPNLMDFTIHMSLFCNLIKILAPFERQHHFSKLSSLTLFIDSLEQEDVMNMFSFISSFENIETLNIKENGSFESVEFMTAFLKASQDASSIKILNVKKVVIEGSLDLMRLTALFPNLEELKVALTSSTQWFPFDQLVHPKTLTKVSISKLNQFQAFKEPSKHLFYWNKMFDMFLQNCPKMEELQFLTEYNDIPWKLWKHETFRPTLNMIRKIYDTKKQHILKSLVCAIDSPEQWFNLINFLENIKELDVLYISLYLVNETKAVDIIKSSTPIVTKIETLRIDDHHFHYPSSFHILSSFQNINKYEIDTSVKSLTFERTCDFSPLHFSKNLCLKTQLESFCLDYSLLLPFSTSLKHFHITYTYDHIDLCKLAMVVPRIESLHLSASKLSQAGNKPFQPKDMLNLNKFVKMKYFSIEIASPLHFRKFQKEIRDICKQMEWPADYECKGEISLKFYTDEQRSHFIRIHNCKLSVHVIEEGQ